MYQTVYMHYYIRVPNETRTIGKENIARKWKLAILIAFMHITYICTTMATAIQGTILYTQYDTSVTHPKRAMWNEKLNTPNI